MRNKMGKKILLGIILGTVMISGASAKSGMKTIQKKAFSTGIKKTLDVISYERSQSTKAITETYCISLRNKKGGNPKAFDAVKMESLSLYLKYKPSFLSTLDKKGGKRAILCFDEDSATLAEAEDKLDKIRKDYDKIDDYSPSIILLSPSFERIIPSVGEIYPDRTKEVSELKDEIKNKDNEIVKLKKKMDVILEKTKGNSGLKPFATTKKKSKFSVIENTDEVRKKAIEVEVYKDKKHTVKAEKKDKRILFVEHSPEVVKAVITPKPKKVKKKKKASHTKKKKHHTKKKTYKKKKHHTKKKTSSKTKRKTSSAPKAKTVKNTETNTTKKKKNLFEFLFGSSKTSDKEPKKQTTKKTKNK